MKSRETFHLIRSSSFLFLLVLVLSPATSLSESTCQKTGRPDISCEVEGRYDLNQVKARFQALFKNTPIMSVSDKAPIPGFYEVISGRHILYFDPVHELLIVGAIYDGKQTNLTALRRKELIPTIYENINLTSALKIGDGNQKVIMFTDPDCPHCTRARDFFISDNVRKKITLYVFFRSLTRTNEEDERIVKILSSEDPVKAYLSYQRSSNVDLPGASVSERGKQMAKEHQVISSQLGIPSVPLIYTGGNEYLGFDPGAMRRLFEGN